MQLYRRENLTMRCWRTIHLVRIEAQERCKNTYRHTQKKNGIFGIMGMIMKGAVKGAAIAYR